MGELRGTFRPGRAGPGAPRAGIVLMEVVFAMALFFTTASVVMLGTSRAIRAAGNLRRAGLAADLAVTLLSEIQMGLLPPVDAGPESYEEPLEEWTWEVAAEPLAELPEETDIVRVEITITHSVSGYTYRLAQLMPSEEGEPTEPLAPEEPVDDALFGLPGAGP